MDTWTLVRTGNAKVRQNS